MRGARNMDIDWHDADMQCDGGPRPGQQGLRLTFAGPALGGAHKRGAHNLRFVFGIAAAPGVRAAHNVPANVTVIFEGEHELFSTAGDGKCTIDEFSEQPVASQGQSRLRRLSARGFCVAPASALAGRSALLLSRFDFAGAIIDEDPADIRPLPDPERCALPLRGRARDFLVLILLLAGVRPAAALTLESLSTFRIRNFRSRPRPAGSTSMCGSPIHRSARSRA